MKHDEFATCTVCDKPSFSYMMVVGEVVVCDACKRVKGIKQNKSLKMKESDASKQSKTWWYCKTHECGSVRPMNLVRHEMKDCEIVFITREKKDGWMKNTFGGYNGDVGRDYWHRGKINNIARFRDILPHYFRFAYIKWKKEKNIKLTYWEEKTYAKAHDKYLKPGTKTVNEKTLEQTEANLTNFSFIDIEQYFDEGMLDSFRDPAQFKIDTLPGRLKSMTNMYKDYIIFNRIRYRISMQQPVSNVDKQFYEQHKAFLSGSSACINKSNVDALIVRTENKFDVQRESPADMYKDILKGVLK